MNSILFQIAQSYVRLWLEQQFKKRMFDFRQFGFQTTLRTTDIQNIREVRTYESKIQPEDPKWQVVFHVAQYGPDKHDRTYSASFDTKEQAQLMHDTLLFVINEYDQYRNRQNEKRQAA